MRKRLESLGIGLFSGWVFENPQKAEGASKMRVSQSIVRKQTASWKGAEFRFPAFKAIALIGAIAFLLGASSGGGDSSEKANVPVPSIASGGDKFETGVSVGTSTSTMKEVFPVAVTKAPPIIYGPEDFEDALTSEWSYSSSGTYYRNERTTSYKMNGSYGWRQDVSMAGDNVTNRLDLEVKIEDPEGVSLEFYSQQYSDAVNIAQEPRTDKVTKYDGVWITNKTHGPEYALGTYWYNITPTGTLVNNHAANFDHSNSWKFSMFPAFDWNWSGYAQHVINLSEAIEFLNAEYPEAELDIGHCYIRFQQYGTQDIGGSPSDGFVYDDIKIVGGGAWAGGGVVAVIQHLRR